MTSKTTFPAMCPYCGSNFNVRADANRLQSNKGAATCPDCGEKSRIEYYKGAYLLTELDRANEQKAGPAEVEAGDVSNVSGLSVLVTLISTAVVGQVIVNSLFWFSGEPSVSGFYGMLIGTFRDGIGQAIVLVLFGGIVGFAVIAVLERIMGLSLARVVNTLSLAVLAVGIFVVNFSGEGRSLEASPAISAGDSVASATIEAAPPDAAISVPNTDESAPPATTANSPQPRTSAPEIYVVEKTRDEATEDEKALHSAAARDNLDTVRDLLGRGVNPDFAFRDFLGIYMTPLDFAAANGNHDVVKALIKGGATVDAKTSDGVTALFHAAQWGRPDIALTLIAAGANVNTVMIKGATPLMMAAAMGKLEAVNVLIDAGADVNAAVVDGSTAASLASSLGHLDVIDRLTRAGASISNGVLLMDASSRGDIDLVNRLIDDGTDVNVKNNGGETPLLFASEKGRLDVMKALVRAGADVNVKNGDGNTPLLLLGNKETYEAEDEILDVTTILIKAGADVNARNKLGSTAVMEATYGLTTVLRVLIEAGADVNATGNSGHTPLSLAKLWERADSTKILIEAGAKK